MWNKNLFNYINLQMERYIKLREAEQ